MVVSSQLLSMTLEKDVLTLLALANRALIASATAVAMLKSRGGADDDEDPSF